jgi:hypothetical protein
MAISLFRAFSARLATAIVAWGVAPGFHIPRRWRLETQDKANFDQIKDYPPTVTYSRFTIRYLPFAIYHLLFTCRGVAQPGRAHGSGP